MAYEFIRVDRDGPITIMTINRPEVNNATHAPAHAEMDEVMAAFAADPDQWVAILTGAGDVAFSAGGDLKVSATGASRKRPKSGVYGITSRFDCNKPIIAAVNGLAMGGGFEAALACDMIIASETAVFSLPEPKVGIAALGGGLVRLPRDVGMKRAMEIILTCRKVTAAEGHAWGFVNEVVPQAEVLPTALKRAREICAFAPLSIRASKEVAYRSMDEPSLEAAMRAQLRYPAVQALLASEDILEGAKAFAQKRRPDWKGR